MQLDGVRPHRVPATLAVGAPTQRLQPPLQLAPLHYMTVQLLLYMSSSDRSRAGTDGALEVEPAQSSARVRRARRRPAPRAPRHGCALPSATRPVALRSGAARGAGRSGQRQSGAGPGLPRVPRRRNLLRSEADPLHPLRSTGSEHHRPGEVRGIRRSERRGAHRQPGSTPAAATMVPRGLLSRGPMIAPSCHGSQSSQSARGRSTVEPRDPAVIGYS